jgi:hypothetical protein
MDRLGYKCLHFGYIRAYDGYTCALFHPEADTIVSAVGGTSWELFHNQVFRFSEVSYFLPGYFLPGISTN